MSCKTLLYTTDSWKGKILPSYYALSTQECYIPIF
jgi:hypothetical protein